MTPTFVSHLRHDLGPLAVAASALCLHLHDLRHTGSTWTAQSGATLKELMARIGHSITRAAMIYQHATRDRDHAIATALDALIEDAWNQSRSKIDV